MKGKGKGKKIKECMCYQSIDTIERWERELISEGEGVNIKKFRNDEVGK